MNNDPKFRLIHTGLFTNVAYEVLSSVLGQLSDGKWENSRVMDRYWRFASVEKEANGEVLLKIARSSGDWEHYSMHPSRYIPNGFADMDEYSVCRFFADKAKTLMKDELKDNNLPGSLWKRFTTNVKTHYLSYDEVISLAQVYLVYEILKGRSRAKAKYLPGIVDSVIGHALTAEEIARIARANEIEAKRKEAIAELKRQQEAEVAKMNAEFDARLAENAAS